MSNPKYKIAIATRGIDRVDFVQEGNLVVDKLAEMKLDNITSDVLKVPLQTTLTLKTDEEIRDLTMHPHTGHLIMCSPYPDDPRRRVLSLLCVTSDGRSQTSPAITPPTGWEPLSVSVHPETGDLVMGCTDTDGRRYLAALYKCVGEGQWSRSPTHMMEIQGEWGDVYPHVDWVSGDEVMVAIEDRDDVWWLVTLNVARGTELRRVKTECRDITDISVSPERDNVYLCECDYYSNKIHVLTPGGELCHSFPVSEPGSLCAIGGGRVVVCHHVTHGGERSHTVSVWEREGGHVKDLVTALPWSSLWSRVRVSELRREMYVSDDFNTLRKYDLGRRLEH